MLRHASKPLCAAPKNGCCGMLQNAAAAHAWCRATRIVRMMFTGWSSQQSVISSKINPMPPPSATSLRTNSKAVVLSCLMTVGGTYVSACLLPHHQLHLPPMVTCELSRMVLVGEKSAQQAAQAVHKREEKLVKSRKTALGAFRKKVCEM